MKKERSNIQLSSYDDIFGNDASADKAGAVNGDTVVDIPLDELHPFRNHPFKVRDDADMEKTVESIQEFGVLQPAIVRPDRDGGYEILSGHRRHHACQIAGIEALPCIVRDLDDDAATILMVDSNLQREEILPSERAWAFKMKLDAMKRQAGRPSKENCGQVDHNLNGVRSRDILAEQVGDSAKQIQRYIRLTNLDPELLQLVDDKQMGFNPAYELSFLNPEQQKDLLSAIDYAQAIPSLSQAQRIKKLALNGEITQEGMNIILSEEKKQDLDRVTLKHDTLKKYFPKSYTPKQMEDTIIKLLDQWQKKRNRDMER
ncbi:ParB/RepB/Spo0J family partition protein [Agathobacter ruminis]|uniref:Chromosome partitioning protein ParB n=1 Tax=Agathobacter ruminis TaxID=1712665 RepID=A0A2G3E647_9FIRM|nr:ParB/RepB/Spo0J family partition protein [Agathobacter ruminis]MDC7301471.1 ParB/RepB/Spo0J family partition protein [Agathobacter ruminis]PHU38749.1 chromosome partitioning protein ParB [Agathobacter ruminis]